MAIFDNAKNKTSELKEGASTFGSNLRFLANTTLNENYKTKLSTDNLKNAFNLEMHNPYRGLASMMKFEYPKDKNVSYLQASIFYETNPFYLTRIKSSLLKVINDKLTSKVISGVEFVGVDDVINVEVLANSKNEDGEIITNKSISAIAFTIEDIESIASALLLYGNTYIKIKSVDGVLFSEIIEPFKIVEVAGGFAEMYSTKNGVDSVEKRVMIDGIAYIEIWKKGKNNKMQLIKREVNPLGANMIFKIDSDINLVTDGVIEQILMMSELDTLLQKEIHSGASELFIDKTYLKKFKSNGLREHYVQVDSPQNAEGDSKPLYEVYSPNLRGSDIQILKNICMENIALIYKLDKTAIGLDNAVETATATMIKNQGSIDTINKVKKDIEKAINLFILEYFQTNNVKISMGKYVIDNRSENLDYVTNAINGGVMTTKQAVELLYPNLLNEEQEELYLNLMYKNGEVMNAKEVELAKKYGIIVATDTGEFL